MPGTVIGKSLGHGFPGQYARTPDHIVRTFPAGEEIPFGAPVMLDDAAVGDVGGVKLLAAGSDGTAFIGIAARVVKSAVLYPNQNFGAYSEDDPVGVVGTACRQAVDMPVTCVRDGHSINEKWAPIIC